MHFRSSICVVSLCICCFVNVITRRAECLLRVIPAMRQNGQFERPRNSVQMKLDVRISGDITVNFGPNSITMIKHIQTTEPHIGIDKVSILS